MINSQLVTTSTVITMINPFPRQDEPDSDSGCVCSSPFVHPSNYAITTFERHGPDGSAYTQMHIAAVGLTGIMNAQNYLSLLGFAQGNLLEVGASSESSIALPSPLQVFMW